MKALLLAAISLFITACDAGTPENRGDTVGTEIAEDYNRAMDKARGVEVQMQDHVDSMERSVEDVVEAQDP